MTKINGTYFALHQQIGRFLYPYYKGGMEFREEVNLANMITKTGSLDSSETYFFNALNNANSQEFAAKMAEIERMFENKIPAKSLLFTESNSAHHLTYFYAKEIARQLEDNQKLLIINFDQHEDYGTADGKFFCGSWGSRITAAVPCDYVAAGIGKDGGILSVKSDGTRKKYRQGQLGECLAERHRDCEKIYVTVDLDVLICSEALKRTNWGSGKMTLAELRNNLEILPDEKMIAADITGFPPAERRKLEEQQELYDEYIENIREIAEVLCGLMGIAPQVV